MTVKELKAELEEYDDDTSVFIGIDTIMEQRIDVLWGIEEPRPNDKRFSAWIHDNKKQHCIVLSN